MNLVDRCLFLGYARWRCPSRVFFRILTNTEYYDRSSMKKGVGGAYARISSLTSGNDTIREEIVVSEAQMDIGLWECVYTLGHECAHAETWKYGVGKSEFAAQMGGVQECVNFMIYLGILRFFDRGRQKKIKGGTPQNHVFRVIRVFQRRLKTSRIRRLRRIRS